MAKKKENTVEQIMRDYARASLTHCVSEGRLDPDSRDVIKAASDEFLDGCVAELLGADVGAIIRLSRPSKKVRGVRIAQGTLPQSNGKGNGGKQDGPQKGNFFGLLEDHGPLPGDEGFDF